MTDTQSIFRSGGLVVSSCIRVLEENQLRIGHTCCTCDSLRAYMHTMWQCHCDPSYIKGGHVNERVAMCVSLFTLTNSVPPFSLEDRGWRRLRRSYKEKSKELVRTSSPFQALVNRRGESDWRKVRKKFTVPFWLNPHPKSTTFLPPPSHFHEQFTLTNYLYAGLVSKWFL